MVEFLSTVPQTILLIIVGLLTTTVFTGMIGFFRKKTICLQKLANDIDSLQKRSYRIEKALIILVKLQEEQVKATHPEIATDWEDIVKELIESD
jgi:biopolymer transport protein ExbB/TolQ